MATSGSSNFNQTRDEIIKDALLLINVIDAEESVEAEDAAYASRVLNRMIKAWQAQGIHMWTETEATVFFAADTVQYSLGSSADHASNTVVETTLGGDEAASQTVLTVTSSTGMTAADNVGIELDDGTIQWTTIVSVDSSTQITVTAALTSAAGSGNAVYTYTTRLGRPLDIIDARLRDQDDLDRRMTRISREDYMAQPDKTTESQPLHYFYDPQLTNGQLYIWPEPSNMKERLKITYRRSIEDFDDADDNPDLPQEWLEAIVYNLAVRLASAFGMSQKVLQDVGPLAGQFLENMRAWDHDKTSIKFIPDTQR